MLFNWKLFPGTNLQDLNLDWIINFVKMIPSRLPKFSDHHTWLVYDYSTGEYYDSGEPTGGAGEPGEPGKSPIIGANGNWYTWNTETETYTDTGTRAQGVQGEPGPGVASGGVVGDVLVKASGVDYNTGWTTTPPQMGSLAHINAGNTADKEYQPGEYLVYNGQLYKVGNSVIAQGVTLNPGEGGNISLLQNGGINELNADIKNIVSATGDATRNDSVSADGACQYTVIADKLLLIKISDLSFVAETGHNTIIFSGLPTGYAQQIFIINPWKDGGTGQARRIKYNNGNIMVHYDTIPATGTERYFGEIYANK